MPDKHPPHPLNDPGPFYIENGCCTTCGVLENYIPDLVAYDKDRHCFIRQQPATAVEMYGMIQAVDAAEFRCLRYRGDDPDLQRRLAEAGLAAQCDTAAPLTIRPLFRNHVTFQAPPEMTNADIAEHFRAHLSALNLGISKLRLTPITSAKGVVSFSYGWYHNWSDSARALLAIRKPDLLEVNWCPVTIQSDPSTEDRRLLVHSPAQEPKKWGFSLGIDHWLRSDPRFQALRWYTAEAWQAGGSSWRETPI
jgi:hypothetical protein